jgi:cyclic di-GMP phosphodiesterase
MMLTSDARILACCQNCGLMTGKPNILIVENDTPTAMRMICFLTDAGFDVQITRTVQAGMELALETKFDLIVLDLDLPGGFDICRELKQRHFTRHTPVVFVSERSSLEEQQNGLGAGAADYITKPFDTSDFIQRILLNLTRKASTAYMDNEEPVESETLW